MENWLNTRSGISAVELYIYFFCVVIHYYKFSRIGRPVLGRYISVNKENVSLSHTYVYLTKKKEIKNRFIPTSIEVVQNEIPPQPMPKCVYIASHSIRLHPIHGLRVGVSPEYITNSLIPCCVFFSWFYCFDEHFLITILCDVCCACVFFLVFVSRNYFFPVKKEKKRNCYLFPRWRKKKWQHQSY